MKISLNWIKDFVKIPDELEMSKLAYDLTMSTVEVEGMTNLGQQFEGIVVGLINDVKPHPNADKLRICIMDVGDGNLHEIVCGGINLEIGMKVAVALPGAKVRWHGEGDLVSIGKTKVRGVESFGMICAASEIGLSDLFPEKHEAEILDLTGCDAKAGTPLAIALELEDIILEIDNKSMTNRPDLWGHYGIAREIAAIYGLELIEIPAYTPPSTSGFEVDVADIDRCPRYIGSEIVGLDVKPSPFKIQSRIWRVGMRPINAIVDITNYVMLTTGQPTHAFDADRIKGHITVRRARSDEKLLLLDGKELSLSGDDLVIADDENAVGLAGVMGGEKDSVLPTTSKVILEIANFDAISIRRTAARYETRTEAATRYEKAIDPERCDIALSLAMTLFSEIFPQMSVTGFVDKYSKVKEKNEINISLDWLRRRLGKILSNQELADKLERLGFTVSFSGDNMCVIAPSWRSTGDVSISEDIVEEVARLYGLENFEATPITTTFTGAINQLDVDVERKVKEYLAFRCGMREIFTYPWISDEFVNAILQTTSGMLSLSSPPSPNEKYLRSSLLPNLCKAVASNLRYYGEFSIFETAQVLLDGGYSSSYDSRESLPLQRKNVAGAFVGDIGELDVLFRRAKGTISSMSRYTHIEPLDFNQSDKPIWADDNIWLNIIHCGKKIGNIGLLSKKAALNCGIKNSSVILFELDIDALKPFASRTNAYTPLPEYPMVEYDLSLICDLSVKWSDMLSVIREKQGTESLLRSVSFIDEYRGKQVPSGKKSITIRLVIGSLKKTLTSNEIEQFANLVVKRLNKSLGAELRN